LERARSARCASDAVSRLHATDALPSVATPNRQRYRRNTADADRPRRRRAQIDDPAAHERATIVDPPPHGAPIATVDDGAAGAEGQRAMGGSHAARVHMLAACGLAAAVDRGEAGPAERRARVQAAGIAGVLLQAAGIAGVLLMG